MLATESRQVGFFDAAGLVRPLPEGSFYALLAEHGERIVRDEDFVGCYSERRGRPSIPPSKLAKVLLLQHRTGLSDEQAMEAVCWDLRWKVALGLAVDHQGWHPTTMTKFRARLLLHGKERLALENTLRLAEQLGLLTAPAEQIVDSTPMLGAAATQDTVRLVRSGVRGLIDAVQAADAEAARLLDDALAFDYQRPSEKPDCRWREKAERERMLTRVAEDAERALRAGRILSVHDPEMRHGRKSQHQRFDGYKLSAAATNTAEPLITAVAVAPASEQDGPQAKTLVDRQPPERKPKRLLGDTAYGSGPVRSELAAREVEVLAPVPSGSAGGERLQKRDFEIDLERGTVSCPAGEVAPVRTEPAGQRRASFAKAACDRCPLRQRCVAPSRGIRQVLLAPDEELLIAARQALDDPDTADHLRRTRPRIERLLSLLAHRYGARKSRYLGRQKAELQAAWAAALVNLNPIGRHLAAAAA